MRKNIRAVLEAFSRGEAKARSARKALVTGKLVPIAGGATCSTDGTRIYSYALPIVMRRTDGSIWILSEEDGMSATTRGQIRAAERGLPLIGCNMHSECVDVPSMGLACMADSLARGKL